VASKKSHLPIALIVDLILVVLFTIVGHYTHSHNFDPEGLMTTAWPFVASLVLAWLLAAVWDRPISPLATGTGVWAITVLVGLVLRGVTGAGGEPGTVPVSFMIVAASLNLITLVGWRIIASAVAGGPSRRGRSR
jgi:FtsH-binding integral membrane protein